MGVVRTNPAKYCVEPVVPSSSQGLLVHGVGVGASF